MKGIVASSASWDAVVKLAGDNAGHMEIKEKAGKGGDKDVVVKKLYVNKGSLGQSSKNVSNEVYASRLAAANSVREKFREKFEAQYPIQTNRVLTKFAQNKYVDGFKGIDVLEMQESMQRLIQNAGLAEHFDNLDAPEALKTSSKLYYVDGLRKNTQDGDELRGIKPGDLKTLSEAQAVKLRQSSYDRAVSYLAGLALKSPEFEDKEFGTYEELAEAVNAEGLIGLTMPGMSGRAVFLAPEVLNNKELDPVKKIITLAVLAETVTNKQDNLLNPKDDAARDVHLALKILGRDFNFSDATSPGVDSRHSLQERLLNIILSEFKAVDDDEEGLAGSHRALPARLAAEQRNIDKLMQAAKSAQERLDLPARDVEKTTEADNRQNPEAEMRVANDRLASALRKKNEAMRSAVQRSVDAELQGTGSPGGVISKLLNDLAGEKGKTFAKKAARTKGAEMNHIRNRTKNAGGN